VEFEKDHPNHYSNYGKLAVDPKTGGSSCRSEVVVKDGPGDGASKSRDNSVRGGSPEIEIRMDETLLVISKW
jgi:hypothetical protein